MQSIVLAILICIAPLSLVGGQSRADSVAVEIAAARYMRAHVLDRLRARFYPRAASVAAQPNRDDAWIDAILGALRTAEHDTASALACRPGNCPDGDVAVTFNALEIKGSLASMEVGSASGSHSDIEVYAVELVCDKGAWLVRKWTLSMIGEVAVPDKKPPGNDQWHRLENY